MSNLERISKSVEQLIRSNDSQAVQFSDIFIDTLNVSHSELRSIPNPAQIGTTLFLIITKKLATDEEVIYGLTLAAFWCLWKARTVDPTNDSVRASINWLFLTNPALIRGFYERGQSEMKNPLTATEKKEKMSILIEQQKLGTIDEHKDFGHFGKVIFDFLDARLFR